MARNSGGRNARIPESGFPSLNSDSPITGEGDSVRRLLGSSDITIDDLIGMHLVQCTICREVSEHARPVPIGQRSGHCNEYWQLQLMRAQHEGSVNNIVAYTEHGDQAPKGGGLS